MKRLLILVDKTGSKKELLAKHLDRCLRPNARVSLGTFGDLFFEIKKGGVGLRYRKEDIRKFDLVYFRRVGREFYALAGAVAASLDLLGVRYFDRVFGTLGQMGATGDKLTGMIKLAAADLPVLPSVFCLREQVEKHSREIAGFLGLPLVAKEITLQQGKGVFLVQKEEEIKVSENQGRDQQFLWQKFIKSEEEYRLLVLGGKVAVWERKRRTNPEEFRSNVALGAKEEFLPLDSLPRELELMAVKAAKTLHCDVAGVDVLIEKRNGRAWLLEVNRGPGLTYDPLESPELDQMAVFFAKELGAVE